MKSSFTIVLGMMVLVTGCAKDEPEMYVVAPLMSLEEADRHVPGMANHLRDYLRPLSWSHKGLFAYHRVVDRVRVLHPITHAPLIELEDSYLSLMLDGRRVHEVLVEDDTVPSAEAMAARVDALVRRLSSQGFTCARRRRDMEPLDSVLRVRVREDRAGACEKASAHWPRTLYHCAYTTRPSNLLAYVSAFCQPDDGDELRTVVLHLVGVLGPHREGITLPDRAPVDELYAGRSIFSLLD